MSARGNRAALLRIVSDSMDVVTTNVSGGVHFMKDLTIDPVVPDAAVFDASVSGLATRSGYQTPSWVGRQGEVFVESLVGGYRLWVYNGSWRKLDLN